MSTEHENGWPFQRTTEDPAHSLGVWESEVLRRIGLIGRLGIFGFESRMRYQRT
jgi:hypothetical protein